MTHRQIPHLIGEFLRLHADRRNGGLPHFVWHRESGSTDIRLDVVDGDGERIVAAADVYPSPFQVIIKILMCVESGKEALIPPKAL